MVGMNFEDCLKGSITYINHCMVMEKTTLKQLEYLKEAKILLRKCMEEE
jgi:hypothetical protein